MRYKKYFSIVNFIQLLFGGLVLYFLYDKSLLFLGSYEFVFDWVVFSSCVLFLTSQVFKAIRIYLIAESSKFSLLNIVGRYYIINSVALILPFKLGEIFRIGYYRDLFGSAQKSALALMIERVFDLGVLLLILLLILQFDILNQIVIRKVSLLMLVFILCALFCILVAEQICQVLQRITLDRLETRRSALLFKISGVYLSALNEIRRLLKNKSISILGLTILIWACELMAFINLFMYKVSELIPVIYLSSLITLSALLPAGPLGYGGVQLAHFWFSDAYNGFVSILDLGSVFTVYAFGVCVGLLLFVIYRIRAK